MSQVSSEGIERAARITSLVLGIVPIGLFLGFTVKLLIYKWYHVLPYHGLEWYDIRIAVSSQLLWGLVIGVPLLIARFVAGRKPLVGAIAMMVLAVPFISLPIIAGDTSNWAATLGLIYLVPAALYLAVWDKRRS